jgi:hypothetical protein
MTKQILITLLLLTFIYAELVAQVKEISVDPSETDARIKSIHGKHVAFLDTTVKPINRLLLMIVGTDASADHNIPFFNFAASMGYHVISLDYKNTVITTVCSNSNDSACFNNFRQEIMFGTPVSPQVEVDSANSIYHRFYALLSYLAKNYPQQGWTQYVNNNAIQWQKIIVAGHSQGAGHAAFIGKKFPVYRVLIFAGPQDFFVHFNSPAGWVLQKGITNSSKYFAFLHVKDPYDFNKQLTGCITLMHITKEDTLMVQQNSMITKSKHILVTNIESANPHESMMQPGFEKAWTYLLSADPGK